jgi:hypothetical protein
MGDFVDLVGIKFGQLTVLGRTLNKSKGNTTWICKCSCGNESIVQGGALKRGAVVSCGCYHKQVITTHGMEATPIYNAWAAMKSRCTNINNRFYKDYGGRGITFCERWNDFMNFYEDMGERPNGMSLERKDNAKGYEPSNCKWATKLEQRRNTRANIWLEYEGQKKVLTEWAEILNLSPETIRSRLRGGWSAYDALSTRPNMRPTKN